MGERKGRQYGKIASDQNRKDSLSSQLSMQSMQMSVSLHTTLYQLTTILVKIKKSEYW